MLLRWLWGMTPQLPPFGLAADAACRLGTYDVLPGREVGGLGKFATCASDRTAGCAVRQEGREVAGDSAFVPDVAEDRNFDLAVNMAEGVNLVATLDEIAEVRRRRSR